MADDAFATLNGYAVADLVLIVNEQGPWFAEVQLEQLAPKLAAGPAKLVINGVALECTVDQPGTYGQAKSCRVIAGGGGWGKVVSAHGYGNDARVKARLVADDAARAAGESIGTFEPAAERLEVSYARTVGAASVALEDAAGGALWWVGYDGKTNVAKDRPTTKAAPDTYEVLAFNPRTQVVELGVTGLTVGVGSIISERLDAPATIRSFTLRLSSKRLTMTAVCGELRTTNQLVLLVRRIVERVMNGWLFGAYRYRVVSMGGDGRVNLQAVAKGAGVPDLLRIEQWPGVAGAHATLQNGAIVVVQFLEGRRDLPVITNYAGVQSSAFVPDRLVFGAKNPNQGVEIAYKGAQVECLFPPMIVSGTMIVSGVPTAFTATAMQPTGKLQGQITTGTPRVRVATS